ncbi:hypothetical protein CEUSTIGMA_g2008.t1 [Chlamydomonas eustigma]|uniref:Uncharacterized protein n=1 Tax=Chlamydomonas eustigma TaxID=1157962 RepID=A0A250WV22_9CHLO|nr:hypothetical protein CEUSTIGMA_g2008.t1 [Chlamydomonas eustigma]|eukprot:GAX74559.1 hypothetical protein CEUSTIGMA_g2008.t1 [Chlamydomonas eustigma]
MLGWVIPLCIVILMYAVILLKYRVHTQATDLKMSSTEENPVHSVVMRAAKKHNWSDARVGMISRLMTGGRLASAIKDTLVRSGRESDYGTGDGLIRKSGTDSGLPSPIKSPHAAGLLKPPLSLPIQSRTKTSMCIPPTEVDILSDLRKVGSSHQLFGSSQSTQGFVSRSDSPLSAPLIAPLLTNVHLQTGTSQHQPVLLTSYVSLDRVLEEDLALGELVDCSDAYLMSGDVSKVGSANSLPLLPSLPSLPETALPGSVGQLSMMPGSISYHPCPPSISKLATPFQGPSQMTPTMTWSAHADYSAGGDISPAHESSMGVGGGTRLSAYPTSSTDSVASGVEMGRRKSTLPLRTSEISTSLSRLHSRTSPGAHMLFSKDYPQLNENSAILQSIEQYQILHEHSHIFDYVAKNRSKLVREFWSLRAETIPYQEEEKLLASKVRSVSENKSLAKELGLKAYFHKKPATLSGWAFGLPGPITLPSRTQSLVGTPQGQIALGGVSPIPVPRNPTNYTRSAPLPETHMEQNPANEATAGGSTHTPQGELPPPVAISAPSG